MKDDDEYPSKPRDFGCDMNTLVARVFMAFLAQDRRKPKTFQAPHYQRDPPGVQVFMGGTIRETPKALPDDHHGNPTPNPFCFLCCLLFKFSSLPFVEAARERSRRTLELIFSR